MIFLGKNLCLQKSPGPSAVFQNASKVIKLEKENAELRVALKKLNLRVGDDIIDDSDPSTGDDHEEIEHPVNTRHYQIDEQLAPKYYFITNVNCIPINIFNCC